MKWSDKVIIKHLKTGPVICMLFMAYVLAACSGLTQSDKPVTTTWWLEPYVGVAQTAVTETVIPLSLTVTVVPGLDTDQILTLSDAGELKPYAGARWADNLPELIASLVGRTLESSGRFDVLTRRAGRGARGCDLQLELREFFTRLDSQGNNTATRVAIHGRLQCGSADPLIIQSSTSVPVAAERMSDIVSAFQQAMDYVLQDMLNKIQ